MRILIVGGGIGGLVAGLALDTVACVNRYLKTPAGMPMDHPSAVTMRQAHREGLGTSARYRFSSENSNSSRRIDSDSASIVRRGSSGHDANRATPPSCRSELNSLSGSVNSSAECFSAIARAAEALKRSVPLKKSSHEVSCPRIAWKN